MKNPIIDYYKGYYESNGYSMQGNKDTSRVAMLIEWVKKYVPKGGTILDVGCGDMYLATQLPDYKWTGLDINTAKALGNAVEHDISIAPYPFEMGSFDAVVCSEVLEHVWDPTIINAEIYRVLKVSGTYLLSTPNYDHADHYFSHFKQLLFDSTVSHLYEHIRQYNFYSHQVLLNKAGFYAVERCGADAQYSQLFVEARVVLKNEGYTQTEADVVIGKMFPEFSHTIMIVAKKK